MAWTTARVPYDPHTRSSASMQEAMLMWDEALITAHVLKESTPPNRYVMRGSTSLHHHHLPHTFFPFSLRDTAGDHVHNMPMSGSMANACGDIRQAMETMKRPLFWPSLEGERVKGTLSPECNAVHEQSGSTSEFCNVSNTTIMERMLSNEEVEMNFNEGESRIRKKKRLTGEQVKTLEHSFDADKKLEAERKQDLARRLGLEPRQVAVWFQNRRARSKTKHLEQDFALLKSKYHSLLAETHKLRSEVSRLTAELEESRGETSAVKPGISPKLQIAPDHVPLRNSTSHRFSTKNVKSNSVAEAAHTVHESSTLLGDSGGKHAVTNYSGIKQSATASPLISHTQENSHDNNVVEGDYNIGPACISAEDQQYQLELHAPCSELVACLTEATFTRLENTDIGHSSSFAAYLKKVNAAFHDIHKLQAGDDCLQPLRLWELTA